MQRIEDRLAVEVDSRFGKSVDLLATLVRTPSTLGSLGPAQTILFRALRQIGLDASIDDLDPAALASHPDYVPTAWGSLGQPNVRGVLAPKQSGGGRSLVLNGHMDVVPAEPLTWWTFDPWGAEIHDGRMYGRGALDMKSGLVAALLAIEAVQATKVPLRGPVLFESVIEEECTGNGMLAARQQSGPIDGAIIIEPTDQHLWMATLGVLWFEITAYGRPAYVGRSRELVSAIDVASSMMHHLRTNTVEELNSHFEHPDFAHLEQPLTLNIGKIEAGAWPSSVALECTFTCRMSFPLGWSIGEAKAFVERHVQEAIETGSFGAVAPPRLRFPGFHARGWESAPDSPLIPLLETAHRQVTRDSLVRTVFPGTADARYFDASRGEHVAYYGPSGANLHAPDEFVELASIRDVAKVLAHMIVEWCG